jgi:hypothetical protein
MDKTLFTFITMGKLQKALTWRDCSYRTGTGTLSFLLLNSTPYFWPAEHWFQEKSTSIVVAVSVADPDPHRSTPFWYFGSGSAS